MTNSRQSKSKRPTPLIRGILGRNVAELRDQVYSRLPNVTARNKQLAEDIEMSPEQVRRICNGDLGVSIDYVEWLATALNCRAADLLTPNFAARRDASQPVASQEVSGAASLQRRKG